MKIISLSENTVLILFEQKINHDVFQKVKSCVKKIDEYLGQYLVDIIPSYASIHIVFSLAKISHQEFLSKLEKALSQVSVLLDEIDNHKILSIPVYYGDEVALDLEFIAANTGLSIETVIQIHSDKIYDVYAIGFAPGFAYLGNVDERIAFPRKQTPRAKIARGSLGLADQQTAIYPSDSPGGWQIIGKTPINVLDYNSQNLTKFEVGNKVKFIPIDRDAFLQMGGSL